MKSHYIHLYYGFGKGKTTAALGLALRALGYGKKVIFLQWLKGKKTIGEMQMAKSLGKNFVMKQFGPAHFTWDKKGDAEHKSKAKEGLGYLEKAVSRAKFDVLVLDELMDAVVAKYIPKVKTLSLIKKAAKIGEVIITGHKPDKDFVKIADLITEMKKQKHYFDKGQAAREGIEY
ncbi:MAG: cob(I)yrinic acid a,c-diamide adenosyltransferase [Patescibacteria group bacterium]|nr:cob(I)yrinic acid a,c-diamide adenosyltransferase [Patescibacteria group bacterium]